MDLRFSIVPKMDPHYLWIPVIGLVLLDVIGVIGVAYGAFPVSPLYILYLVHYREKTLSFSLSLSSHTYTHTHTHTHTHTISSSLCQFGQFTFVSQIISTLSAMFQPPSATTLLTHFLLSFAPTSSHIYSFYYDLCS